MKRRVFVVAGEHSGDAHGAELMCELAGDADFAGLGGPKMHAFCPKVVDWVAEAAVMGVVEVAKRYPFFKKKFAEVLEGIGRWKPDVLLLVDYQGFNLRLALAVKQQFPQVKTVQYVAPQVWAWNERRMPRVVRAYDLMLCLFPFEVPLFEKHGLRSRWVGHPLVDELEEGRIETKREEKLVALLPGSRRREIEGLFPVMLQAVRRVRAVHPEATFVVPAADDVLRVRLEELREKSGIAAEVVTVVPGGAHALMQRAACGVVASGTATLEAAFYGLPFCLAYRVGAVMYRLARFFVKIRFIGLANILADRELVPEFIQAEANDYEIAAFLNEMLGDEEKRKRLSAELEAVGAQLGERGMHGRAAGEIRALLERNSDPVLG